MIHNTKVQSALEEGQKYTEEQNPDEELEFNEFIKLMSQEMLENMMDEELIEAFKTFGPQDETDGISKR